MPPSTGIWAAETGHELGDWLRFDIDRIEDRLLDIFSLVADRTKIEWLELQEELEKDPLYHSGEVTGPGTLYCSSCNESLHFHHTARIPTCPKCSNETFRRWPSTTSRATPESVHDVPGDTSRSQSFIYCPMPVICQGSPDSATVREIPASVIPDPRIFLRLPAADDRYTITLAIHEWPLLLQPRGDLRMKRTLTGTVLLIASSTAFAEAPGGPNCGWGNMLFEGQSGTPSHIVATTTNGTSGNNTFGMTSGTNGCSTDGKLTYGGDAMINTSAIMDEFSEDVARGYGDALNAVAVMIGVEQQDRDTFARVMHENFTTIFPSEDVTAEHALASVNTVMKNDPRLAKYAV